MTPRMREWKTRIDGVHYLRESQIFVTQEEWEELKSCGVPPDGETPQQLRAREQREAIARMSGALGHFFGTPVVIDAHEATAQQNRIASIGATT